MSRTRMQDLLDALEASGWYLLSSQESEGCSDDPFELERERIVWHLVRGHGQVVDTLEFLAFTPLGERTDRIEDIRYCTHVGTGHRLFFEKRTTDAWRLGVNEFVRCLQEWASRGRR